jgi:DNA polymerase-4
MIVARALHCCRELAIVAPDDDLYARASSAVACILRRYTPLLEPAGYGHAFLDVSGTGRLFGPPRDTAWRLRNDIEGELRLRASLGVAGNKMVSRIASLAGRRSGLQDVPRGEEERFIAPFPAPVLPGVVPGIKERLDELNLQLVRDIAAAEARHLATAFGRLGPLLHQRALGVDDTPVRPPGSVTFAESDELLQSETNDYGELRVVVSRLAADVSDRLHEGCRRGCTLELLVVYSDHREALARAKLATPADAEDSLRPEALRLLDRALKRRTRVRRLRLRIFDLVRGLVQLQLFPDPQPERKARLEAAVDRLQRLYGKPALRLCSHASLAAPPAR